MSYKNNCNEILKHKLDDCNLISSSRRLLFILARKEVSPSRYFDTTEEYWKEIENYMNNYKLNCSYILDQCKN